jgi:hypothetical protein
VARSSAFGEDDSRRLAPAVNGGMMSRGPRFLIMLLLFVLTFLGGIQWERQDCYIDWPSSMDQVMSAVHCPDTQPATSQPPTSSIA